MNDNHHHKSPAEQHAELHDEENAACNEVYARVEAQLTSMDADIDTEAEQVWKVLKTPPPSARYRELVELMEQIIAESNVKQVEVSIKRILDSRKSKPG